MGPDGGSIVNIGSIVGSMPARQASLQLRAKPQGNAITVSHSQELAPGKSE